MSKTQQEPYESDNTTITDVIEQIITNELEPTEIDANQCSCCWILCKSFKCIWVSVLNVLETICKGSSYLCIGCSNCALGCHDCLEQIDCDET